MITSFAQFLQELQAKEAALLAEEEVRHGPTIGDMYEGLARELLERAIPNDLNLRLLQGFVVGVDGKRSNQMDAMLVMGERGRQLPRTDSWGNGRLQTSSPFLRSKRIFMAPNFWTA